MDLQLLMPWLLAATTILNLGTLVYNLMSSSSKKNAAAISDLTALMAAHGSRIQSLESDMKHLPDAKAVADLRLAISDLGGKIGRMEESQSNSARTINRVEEFLLKQAS